MSEESGQGIRSYVQSTIKYLPPNIADDPQWRSPCAELVRRADGVFSVGTLRSERAYRRLL